MTRYKRRPFTFDRVCRIFFSVCAIAVALWLLNILKGVLLPFIVACVAAYMMEPFVLWNKKILHMKSRFIPVMLTLLEVCAVCAGFCWAFFPYLSNECSQMGRMLADYANKQIDIPYVSENIQLFIRENVDLKHLSKMLSPEQWENVIRKSLSSSWNVLSSGFSIILSILSWCVAFLYLLFIMLDYEKLMLSFKQMIPPHHRNQISSIFSDIEHAMNRYFRGQTLIAFLVGILFSIGFAIIDLPMGIILGLFIGVLNLVPYLQLISLPITGILCLVWTVSTGGDFWLIFWEAMVVYIVVQCIQDLILTPKIMGKTMGLNPAIILLALSVWGTLLGFIGLIIALPLTTLLISYYNQYFIKNANEDPNDPDNNSNPATDSDPALSQIYNDSNELV